LIDQPVDIPAKESAWVYARATDPTGDDFLRVWGVNGLGAPESGEDASDFSFGFLRIDVSGIPAGRPKKATLILHNIAPPAFSEDDIKDTPLQARSLEGKFSADTWTYATLATVHPGKKETIFGVGKLAKPIDSATPTEIDIDLLKGPNDFAATLAAASSGTDHSLCLALTTAMEPSSEASAHKGVYKVYSAAAKEKELRPLLRLEY
jgi:hypothetical protein